MENKKIEIIINKRNLIWFKFKLFLINNLPNLGMFLIWTAGNKIGIFLSNKFLYFNDKK